MAPLVSIVVPVYNVERYLEDCLKTIVNQTYKNIEILLVDDGSTDSSGKICDCYGGLDSRIRVIHQKNQGLSVARNVALDVARGEYITCIDSDDFVSESLIEKLMQAIIEYKCDISVCGTVYCDERNSTLKSKVVEGSKVIEGKEQIKNLLYCFDIATMAWGKLYKRELFSDVRYPIGKYNEDVFTTYKLLANSKRTIVINRGLYFYRQVSGSITRSSFSLKHLDAIEGTIMRAEFVAKEYPEYIGYAYATVVHTCCKNYERMIMGEFFDYEIEDRIKKIIRNHCIEFLCYSNAAIKTKAFSIVCCVNMRLARYIHNKIMYGWRGSSI